MKQHGTRAKRRWLHLLLAACGTVLLFTAQQLYYDTEDARQDANGEAASILAFMDVVDGPTGQQRLQPAAASLLAQAIGRFNHIGAATYCDGQACIGTDPGWTPKACTRWSLATVCAAAQSGPAGTSVTVRHSLADAHGQTFRDLGFLSVILAVVAVTGSAASARMERRVAQVERERVFAASHDGLTRLPNRAAFESSAKMLQRSAGGASPAVLLYIDLTGFKDVNDNLGHHVGDRILQLAAERIRRGLGEHEILARLGSDEFGVVLHRPDTNAVGDYVDGLNSAFREPAMVLGHTVTIGLNIGAVELDAAVRDFSETMRRADVALYEAKRQGPGGLVRFSQDMDVAARARYRLQSELKQAIMGDQLFLEYQPQVDGDGQLKGVEALVRWRHPSRGLVRPDEFISVAEQSGLIGALGLMVVRMACRDLVAARRQGMHLPYISVNVSPKQLADGSFVDALLEELQPWGLGSRDLELEVTESSLVQSKGGEEAAIRRLAGLGFRIAIDDFGTGYSSLSRLHSMPVDKLKIDRSFVTPLPGSRHDRAIPESILNLAQKLGLKTVAEGVETAEQAAWLRDAGCDLMQGYHFARPMPLSKLIDRMRQQGSASQRDAEVVWAETRPFAES